MAPDIKAILLPDCGDAAVSADFFRSREFCDAEGVTHSLCLQDSSGDIIRVPLIVRSIPGTNLKDAISPYGFPGGTVNRNEPVDPRKLDWSETGLVSIFIRNRVGPPPVLLGGSLRGEVQIVDPRQPMSFRRNHRCDIKRNVSLGYNTRVIPAPQTSEDERRAFHRMYLQTMARQGAHPWYFFREDYIDSILHSDISWLVLTMAPDGNPAAGIIVSKSDDYLHCYLAGTVDDYLPHSPGKNAFAKAVELATEHGMPLNLGGGMQPGDSLEHFKKGFANTIAPYHTHEIICDPVAFCELTRARENSGFFPPYRETRS